jgi:hypothetical protein
MTQGHASGAWPPGCVEPVRESVACRCCEIRQRRTTYLSAELPIDSSAAVLRSRAAWACLQQLIFLRDQLDIASYHRYGVEQWQPRPARRKSTVTGKACMALAGPTTGTVGEAPNIHRAYTSTSEASDEHETEQQLFRYAAGPRKSKANARSACKTMMRNQVSARKKSSATRMPATMSARRICIGRGHIDRLRRSGKAFAIITLKWKWGGQ